MQLDPTVTIGNLLQLGGTVAAIGVAYVKLRERMVALETKIDPMWAEYNRRRFPRRADDREDE